MCNHPQRKLGYCFLCEITKALIQKERISQAKLHTVQSDTQIDIKKYPYLIMVHKITAKFSDN
jgi:hypothetical protein